MPKLVNKFKALRCQMVMMDMHQADLAASVGMSRSELNARMIGRTPWSLADVYRVCQALEIDLAEIRKYFPEKEVLRQKGA